MVSTEIFIDRLIGTLLTTVIRLERSRAHRIVWLLEELNLDYDIKLYHRTESQRAPEELKKIFPLGKSPIIEVDHHNGKESKKLAESGHITNYLIKHFDTNKKLTANTEDDEESVDYFVNFSEGTLGAHLTYLIVHQVGASKAPFFVRPVINAFVNKMDTFYGISEVKLCIDFMEDILAKQAKINPEELYFVGDHLTGADVMLFFNIQTLLDGKRLGDAIDTADYPNMNKFLALVKNRPAYIKAEEKIQTVGKNQFAKDPIS